MGRTEKRRCLSCGESFTAEARNARHQRYCPALPCKAASKRASQAKWLAKPENQGYHRGPEAVARVKAWRAAHPGYSRRKGSLPEAIQEDWVAAAAATATAAKTAAATAPTSATPTQPAQNSCNALDTPLQDFLNAQPVVLVGLVAHILGSALQEDIASALSRLLQLGLDIRGGNHDCDQAALEPRTSAPSARALQLARSPPGAGAHHREG